nr:DUF1385 domain-containing protein [Lachnospiraceae bacterium]
YSGIGGQAVIEGVMMRNGDKCAVAVRKEDGTIAVEKQENTGLPSDMVLKKIPFVRGVVNLVDSLMMGIGSLTYSASLFDEEDEKTKELKEKNPEKAKKKEKAENAFTVLLSLAIAVLLFMVAPYYLAEFFRRFGMGETGVALIEGIVKVIIFLVYMIAISLMEDIKRTYMYHGAEHKCINCIEHGMDLNVENVRKSSRFHKRCGTSFIVFVIVISIIVFMFIRVDSRLLRLVLRLVLIPVIAGISYELIRLAGRHEGGIIGVLSLPGIALQHITTSEPDDSMIEVGIASVEAVFDWREYLAKEKEDLKIDP